MIKTFCAVVLYASLAVAQVSWYQPAGSRIGAVLSVKTNSAGYLYASVLNKGIYRSLNSGNSWTQIAPYATGTWSFTLNSHNHLIASLWNKGIFISTDNGDSWAQVQNNVYNADVRGVNLHNSIFVEAGGKVYRSSDNGVQWREVQALSGGAMFSSNGKMFAVKGTRFSISGDDGTTWSSQELPSHAYSAVADSMGKVFLGLYCDETNRLPSVMAYDSNAQQWMREGPQSTINFMIRHPETNRIFAATHDSGVYIHDDTSSLWVAKNIGLTTTKIYSLALLANNTLVAGTLDGVFLNSTIIYEPLPVELVSFSGKRISNNVELRWTTATETQNYGFEIERKTSAVTNKASVWEKISFIEGKGTTSSPTEYKFIDYNVTSSARYRLKQIDRNGSFGYSKEIEVAGLLPRAFVLQQNFPNPFNPTTTIQYELPNDSHVKLQMYDVLGKEIAIVLNEDQTAGVHQYTLSVDQYKLSSGVYYYTLRAGTFIETRKMLLLQ